MDFIIGQAYKKMSIGIFLSKTILFGRMKMDPTIIINKIYSLAKLIHERVKEAKENGSKCVELERRVELIMISIDALPVNNLHEKFLQHLQNVQQALQEAFTLIESIEKSCGHRFFKFLKDVALSKKRSRELDEVNKNLDKALENLKLALSVQQLINHEQDKEDREKDRQAIQVFRGENHGEHLELLKKNDEILQQQRNHQDTMIKKQGEGEDKILREFKKYEKRSLHGKKLDHHGLLFSLNRNKNSAQAAVAGQPDAKILHQRGQEAERGKEWQTAQNYYEQAVCLGLPSALASLGALLSTQGDAESAHFYFQLAAGVGHPRSMYNLAVAYNRGDGVEKNPQLAAYWYGEAARIGYPDAAYQFGYCLLHGKGVAKEEKQAVSWLEKASDHGHGQGTDLLAQCHQNGLGVPKSEERALTLYAKAAQQGYSKAKEHHSRLTQPLAVLSPIFNASRVSNQSPALSSQNNCGK